MTGTADFSESVEGDRHILRFTGPLTLARIGTLPDRLEGLANGRPMTLDLSQIERMDTVGAWLVYRLARRTEADVTGTDPHMEALLEQVAAADQPVKVRPDRTPPFYRVLGQIGGATATAGRTMLGLVGFFGALLISVWNVIVHPRRFRLNAVTQQF